MHGHNSITFKMIFSWVEIILISFQSVYLITTYLHSTQSIEVVYIVVFMQNHDLQVGPSQPVETQSVTVLVTADRMLEQWSLIIITSLTPPVLSLSTCGYLHVSLFSSQLGLMILKTFRLLYS